MKCALVFLLLTGGLAWQTEMPTPGSTTPAQRGAKAYERGHYEEAQARFAEALGQAESAESEAAILVNLGHCAHHSGKPADALLSYLRAKKRLPGDETVANLVAAARKDLGTGPPTPPSRLEGWTQRMRDLPPLSLALAAVLLLLFACAHALWKRRTITLPGLAFFAGSLALVAALAAQCWLPSPRLAVCLTDRVPLRSEPHLSARPSLVLDQGTTFHVGAFSDRWVLVRLRTGTFWVERDLVGLVE